MSILFLHFISILVYLAAIASFTILVIKGHHIMGFIVLVIVFSSFSVKYNKESEEQR